MPVYNSIFKNCISIFRGKNERTIYRTEWGGKIKKGIWYQGHSHGLGMVFPSSVFPLKLFKLLDHTPSPSPLQQAEENWRHKRQRPQTEIKTIYLKQTKNSNSNNTINKCTRNKIESHMNAQTSPHRNSNNTQLLLPPCHPNQKEAHPQKVTWGGTEQSLCPSHVPPDYCKN